MSESEARTCAATPGCQRTPTTGMVCSGHFARLGDTLAALESEAAALSALPSMQQSQGTRSSGLASERANSRLDVIAMTDRRTTLYGPRLHGPACPFCWHDTCQLIRNWLDAYDSQATHLPSVLGTLHGWARLIREERGFTDSGPVTVSSERMTLARSMEWACGQPWIDEFYSDLVGLLGALRAANGTGEEKPAGRCYLPDDKRGVCGGPVRVDTAAGRAECGRCRQTWDGPQLALLRHALEQEKAEAARPRTPDGRPMLTAAELVEQGYVSSVSNVKTQAHRRGKTSVVGHYDPAWFQERMTG